MPVKKGSMTFSRFRAEPKGERAKDERRWLARGFRSKAFEPLEKNSEEDTASGFVELENKDSTELAPASFIFGDYALVSWRIDRLRVPSPMIKAEVEAWARAFEEREGRPPRRAELREEKELITQKLRRRAFPKTTLTDVSWGLTSQDVLIWTTQRRVVDEIQAAMEHAFDVKLQALSPGAYADRLDLGAAKEDLLAPTAELIRDPAFSA